MNLLPSSEGNATSDQIRIRVGWFRQEPIKSDKPFTFPKITTTTWPYVRNVAVECDDFDYGILFPIQYLKRKYLHLEYAGEQLRFTPSPCSNIKFDSPSFS